MKKETIIICVLLAAVLLWYFLAPIEWTFGLRSPKNYNECIKAGGRIEEAFINSSPFSPAQCNFNGQIFIPKIPNNV